MAQNPNFIEGETPMHPIEIRHEPARRLAAVAHLGPYTEINRAFETLGAIIGARGLFPHAGMMFGVYYEDPSTTPATALRSHAGIAFPDSVQLDPPLEIVHLPEGPHAVLTYKGPYSGLPAAYEQLYHRWLPTSGHHPTKAAPFEIYHNNPMDTAPEDLLTEICVPLA